MRVLRYVSAGLLVLTTAAVVWSGLNLPPPLWVVRYGPFPGCEPTGRTWTIEGVKFVEIGAGISRMGSDWLLDRGLFSGWGFTRGDLLGRLAGPVGVPWGTEARPSWEMPVHWVQFTHGFAIAKTEITVAQFERYALAQDAINVHWEGGADDPVLDLNWEDVKGYCNWLAKRSDLPVRLLSRRRTGELGGDFVLVRPADFLTRGLEILGIDRIFLVFDSEQDAVRHFRCRKYARPPPGFVLLGLLDRPGGGIVHGAGRVVHLGPGGLAFRFTVPGPLSDEAEGGLDATNFDLRARPGVGVRPEARQGDGALPVLGVVETVDRRVQAGMDVATIRVRFVAPAGRNGERR